MTGISDRLVTGVELGGTKAIAVIARGRHIIERATCKTTTPYETRR